jgi:hypothetical protein
MPVSSWDMAVSSGDMSATSCNPGARASCFPHDAVCDACCDPRGGGPAGTPCPHPGVTCNYEFFAVSCENGVTVRTCIAQGGCPGLDS